VFPHELVYVTGVILEEAETKCGGEMRLKRAVDEGRVKEWEGLFYFKRGEVGATRTWAKSQGMARTQDRGVEDWDTFATATEGSMQTIVDELDSLDDFYQHTDPGSSSNGVASVTMDAAIDELDKEYVRLQRAQKTRDAAAEHGARQNSRSCNQKLMDIINDLNKKQETAEILLGKVSFVLKFKKQPNGDTLLVNDIKDMTDAVVALTNDIIEIIKMLKVLAPPAK
jgi:hypothetical protein